MYNTSDADGYVVYCNGTTKVIKGGYIMEATLDRLMPNLSYSITVRAYQDILGPSSARLDVGKYLHLHKLMSYS